MESVKTQTEDVVLTEIRERLNIVEQQIQQMSIKKRKRNVKTQTKHFATTSINDEYVQDVRMQENLQILQIEKETLITKLQVIERQIKILTDYQN